MENKENVLKSRIPVPVPGLHSGRPLQLGVPKKTVRDPLKTITDQRLNAASPSRKTKNASKSNLTTHTKDDQNYKPIKVFEKRPATPARRKQPQPLDASTLKKAKTSSKRCLQGSSPKTLTKEDKHAVKYEQQSWDFLNGACMDELNQNYTGDTMQYLLSKERKVSEEPLINGTTRSCVVNWIVKVDIKNNNPAVIQTTCWNLDRYLSAVSVPINSLQLTAAACYWLAAKYHGYNFSSQRLIRCSNYAFSANELVETEMRMLQKCQYSVQPVVSNDFIPFLCWWCDPKGVDLLESAASFICLSGVMLSRSLCAEYPSVVAGACVRNALVLLRKEELMGRLESCPIFKTAMKKAKDLLTTCAHLRDCLRTLAPMNYEYRSHVVKYSTAPNFVAARIIEAVNESDKLNCDI